LKKIHSPTKKSSANGSIYWIFLHFSNFPLEASPQRDGENLEIFHITSCLDKYYFPLWKVKCTHLMHKLGDIIAITTQ